MRDTIQIRYAKHADLHDVAAFLNNCWQAEYRQIVSDDYLDAMSVKERHKHLLMRHSEKTSEFLMMLDSNRLVGAAVFGKSFTDGYEEDGEISAIYLHKDYIGKGYGHCLFTKAEQALTAKGYSHFVLDLLVGNTKALQFYLAHGYEKAADRMIRLGENDYSLIVLRKKNPFII
jgi:ribosomal protein S18 acetylase RimI-like enzyme